MTCPVPHVPMYEKRPLGQESLPVLPHACNMTQCLDFNQLPPRGMQPRPEPWLYQWMLSLLPEPVQCDAPHVMHLPRDMHAATASNLLHIKTPCMQHAPFPHPTACASAEAHQRDAETA